MLPPPTTPFFFLVELLVCIPLLYGRPCCCEKRISVRGSSLCKFGVLPPPTSPANCFGLPLCQNSPMPQRIDGLRRERSFPFFFVGDLPRFFFLWGPLVPPTRLFRGMILQPPWHARRLQSCGSPLSFCPFPWNPPTTLLIFFSSPQQGSLLRPLFPPPTSRLFPANSSLDPKNRACAPLRPSLPH